MCKLCYANKRTQALDSWKKCQMHSNDKTLQAKVKQHKSILLCTKHQFMTCSTIFTYCSITDKAFLTSLVQQASLNFKAFTPVVVSQQQNPQYCRSMATNAPISELINQAATTLKAEANSQMNLQTNAKSM